MITISAKISPNENASIISAVEMEKNNISSGLNDIINKKSTRENPFLLGIDKFSSRKTYVDDKVGYYIGDTLSNSQGIFETPYNVILQTTTDTTFIIIYFDTINNEYPKNIVVDNDKSYILDSPTFCFTVSKSYTHNIVIYDWNKLDKPLVIQGIQTFISIESNEITNVDFSGQDRSNILTPSWGIKSNTGEIEVYDMSGAIEGMKTAGVIIDSNIKLFLKADNRQEQIGSFYINKAEKDDQSAKIKLNYQDILESWNNYNIGNKRVRSNAYLDNYLNFVLNDMANRIKFFDDETEQLWKSIRLEKAYLKEGSMWATVAKFCEVSGSYVFCDKEGNAVIKYNGGA